MKEERLGLYIITILCVIIICFVGFFLYHNYDDGYGTVTGTYVSGYNRDLGPIIYIDIGRTGGQFTSLNMTDITYSGNPPPFVKDNQSKLVFGKHYNITVLTEGRRYQITYQRVGSVNTNFCEIRGIKELP